MSDAQRTAEDVCGQEIWKPVVGYEGLYEVSNRGRVRRLATTVIRCDGHQTRPGSRIRSLKSWGEYYSIRLCSGGIMATHKVHRLVMAAFVGPSHLEVNHRDGNKLNNNLENLEYVTTSENAQHAYDTGLRRAHPTRGEKSNLAKLTEDKVRLIRLLLKDLSRCEVARRISMSRGAVDHIANGHTWKHVV